MHPSNYLFALIRAFDLETPPAKNMEDFRSQGRLFLDNIMPYVNIIEPLFISCDKKDPIQQFRFDALLSVLYDAGSELFFDSCLSQISTARTSKRKLYEAFTSIPVFNGTQRPEISEQMQLYKMGTLSRRELEFRLFLGAPTFTIGRCKAPSGSIGIVYAPSVMHPMLQFLCRTKSK